MPNFSFSKSITVFPSGSLKASLFFFVTRFLFEVFYLRDFLSLHLNFLLPMQIFKEVPHIDFIRFRLPAAILSLFIIFVG